MSNFNKQINRIALKLFKKVFNTDERIFKDFILDEITKMGWHSFIPATYTHVADWREYYYKNLSSVGASLEKLFENLDATSIEQAQLLFERNINYLPVKNNQQFLKMNLKELYTPHEIEAQKHIQGAENNFKLPENYKIDNYILYYRHGFSFIEDIAAEYVKNKDFIDGGAYIGDSALVLSELNPHKIYSFEPEEKNFNLLGETAKLNSLENTIIPVQMGLGTKDDVLSFSGDKVSGRVSENSSDATIKVTSIDNFVFENNIIPGLIKLDVEGAEFDAIVGAERTIREFKPVLLISVYHTLKDFLEIKPLVEKFADYKFLIRATRPEMLNTEFMLIGYPNFIG